MELVVKKEDINRIIIPYTENSQYYKKDNFKKMPFSIISNLKHNKFSSSEWIHTLNKTVLTFNKKNNKVTKNYFLSKPVKPRWLLKHKRNFAIVFS